MPASHSAVRGRPALDSGVAVELRGLVDWVAEQFEAEWQQRGSLAVGEETEVADADETWWEQMQEEAPEEIVDRQAHALLVALRGVMLAEADCLSERETSLLFEMSTP